MTIVAQCVDGPRKGKRVKLPGLMSEVTFAPRLECLPSPSAEQVDPTATISLIVYRLEKEYTGAGNRFWSLYHVSGDDEVSGQGGRG